MRNASRWISRAWSIAAVVLVGLTLVWLREPPASVSPHADEQAASTSSPSPWRPRGAAMRAPGAPQVPTTTTAALPAGTVPPSRIDPPPPDPHAPMPPPPVEPPNPAVHRLSLHDPGALDRARPQRGPRIESSARLVVR
jgi:hypothetical protein